MISSDKPKSVTEITKEVGRIISSDDQLSNIYVLGEISNLTLHRSGHIYFTLKDENTQLSCAMFKSWTYGLSFRPEEGQLVVAFGSVEVYEPQGRYNLNCRSLSIAGKGSLDEAFEELKAKLEKEGLFKEEHKLKIPDYCWKIGILTSLTGDVRHDIERTVRKGNPYAKMYLYPCHVQGSMTVPDLIKGIEYMERFKPDVIIIARGGGSKEDLWEFNSEELARAVYKCSIPIVSGVGHAPDTTIIDYVADKCCETPTAAGAFVSRNRYSDLEAAFIDCKSQLYHLMSAQIDKEKQKLQARKQILQSLSPKAKLESSKQLLKHKTERIHSLMNISLERSKNRLSVSANRLNGLSPLNSLSRGYAYVTDIKGHNVRSVKQLNINDPIDLMLTDGSIKANVTEIYENSDN